MSNYTLQQVEERLDELLIHYRQLKQENTVLKDKESQWGKERIHLVEKNNIARARIEAMIARLKNLEVEP